MPSAAGARTRPTNPDTTTIVIRYGAMDRNGDGMATLGAPGQESLQLDREPEQHRSPQGAPRPPSAEDHGRQGYVTQPAVISG